MAKRGDMKIVVTADAREAQAELTKLVRGEQELLEMTKKAQAESAKASKEKSDLLKKEIEDKMKLREQAALYEKQRKENNDRELADLRKANEERAKIRHEDHMAKSKEQIEIARAREADRMADRQAAEQRRADSIAAREAAIAEKARIDELNEKKRDTHRIQQLITSGLRTFLMTAAGIGSVTAAWGKLKSEMEATKNAQSAFGGRGVDFELESLHAQDQMFTQRNAGTADLMRGMMLKLSEDSNISDPKTLGTWLASGHTMLVGQKNVPLSGDALSATTTAASISQQYQLDGNSPEEVMKLLSLSAKSKGVALTGDSTKVMMAQMLAGLADTSTVSPSKYMQGLIRYMPSWMAKGGSFEKGIALISQGLSISSSSEEAGFKMKAIDRISGNADAAKLVQKMLGIDAKSFYTSDRDTQFENFSAAFAMTEDDYSKQTLLRKLFEGEELQQSQAFFSPAGRAQVAGTESKVRGLTDSNVNAMTSWNYSNPAHQFMQDQARGFRAGVPLDASTSRGTSALNSYFAKEFEAAKANNTLPIFARGIQNPSVQFDTFVYGKLYNDIQKNLRIAVERGVSVSDIKDLEWAGMGLPGNLLRTSGSDDRRMRASVEDRYMQQYSPTSATFELGSHSPSLFTRGGTSYNLGEAPTQTDPLTPRNVGDLLRVNEKILSAIENSNGKPQPGAN